MALNTKQVLGLVKALIDVAEKDLIDPATGHWYHQPDGSRDLKAVQDVESTLRAAGIPVPSELDKFISLAKAVFDIFGMVSAPPAPPVK